MSRTNVDGFFEKVAGNKSLQAKLKALQKKTVTEARGKGAAALVKIASAAGFKFSAKDLAQVRKATVKKLSKAALVDVAGQSDCYVHTGGYCPHTGVWTCYGNGYH
jgi:predicted ribosomally synthesized peptide with nif11-like leader